MAAEQLLADVIAIREIAGHLIHPRREAGLEAAINLRQEDQRGMLQGKAATARQHMALSALQPH